MSLEFLFRNVGNRITPELAQGLSAAIQGLVTEAYKQGCHDTARAASGRPRTELRISTSSTIEGYQFLLGDYVADLPRFEHLQKLHLAEVETARDPRLQWQANQDLMCQMARDGQMHIFLIAHGEAVVGYMTMQFHEDYGTGQRIGSELHFFIQKEHRKGWLALRFIRWIEETLRQNGIAEMRAGVRDIKDVSAIYRRLHYKPFAHLFSKVL